MDKKASILIKLLKLKIRTEIPKITELKRSTIHFKSLTFNLLRLFMLSKIIKNWKIYFDTKKKHSAFSIVQMYKNIIL